MRNSLAALLALVWLPIPVLAQTLSYDEPRLTGIGALNPDLPRSGAYGISADGRVVAGASGLRLFDNTSIRWTLEDGIEDLGWLLSAPSAMRDASGTGHVLVGHSLGPRGLEGHIWTREAGMVGIGDLPGDKHQSVIGDVSWDGQTHSGSGTNEDGYVAIRWTHTDGFLVLGVLPGGTYGSNGLDISGDGQRIVGKSFIAGGDEAFLWTPEQGMVGLGDLHGGNLGSAANGISADGKVIVGKAANSDLRKEAFRWTEEGGMVGLGDLPGSMFQSVANACNADGSAIVGTGIGLNDDGRNQQMAFLWTEEDGMRSLVDVLETDYGVDTDGWILQIGLAISADGRTIVGWGSNPEGKVEGWVAYLGPGCRADFDDNGTVDAEDVAAYLTSWLESNIFTDWNYNGYINTRDLLGFFNEWVAKPGCE